MILWAILTVMTAVAAVFAAAPFLRGTEASAPRSSATGVYRDQLDEIVREERAGTIEPAEAVTARNEIAKRLVLAERESGRAASSPPADRTYAAIGIAAVIAIGSTILYANMGSPEIASADRTVSRKAAPVSTAELPRRESESAQSPSIASVDEMIQRLVRRLAAKPDDAQGWSMLGWSYMSQDRFAEAADAYAKAIALEPGTAAAKTSRGEALVRGADGVVSDEAVRLFKEAVALDDHDPRARFFLGLRKEQAGEKREALDDWVVLLKEASADEPWTADLRQRIEELASELHVDVAALIGQPAQAQRTTAGAGILGKLQTDGGQVNTPSSSPGDSARVIQEMKPEDRDAMIRGMVDGLQARLEKSPHDAEGWIKLIRSRAVLGEREAAKTALDKALAVFAKDRKAQQSLRAAAQSAGVGR